MLYDQKKTGIDRVFEYITKFFKVVGLILTKPSRIVMLLNFNFRGFFVETGFFKSKEKKIPLSLEDEPIPWVTYAFIFFIEERLNKNQNVFEFGSGNSTLFYAKRCKSVLSIEHNHEWFEKIKEKVPKNSEILFQELEPNGVYSKSAVTSGRVFDLIIVDGRDRVNCVMNSIDALNETGVLILDDAFRENYKPAINFMKERGYKVLDFWGPAPLSFRKKNTTIFYRRNNCLNI